MDWLKELYQNWASGSLVELTAFVLSILYLALAIARLRACWIAGFFGCAIYVGVFWDARYYMDALLQVYYVVMAVYGWLQWGKSHQEAGSGLLITFWRPAQHLIAVALLAAATLVTGWLLATYTDAELPWFDAFTTLFAFFATFLTARRVFENWVYWVVINAVSAWMYWEKDLHYTFLLMLIYQGMSIFGILSWLKALRLQRGAK